MDSIIEYNGTVFENIKHTDEYGNEYWLARELQKTLEYKKWQKFINVIDNAKNACEQSKFTVDDHFTQVGKMIKLAKGAERTILDYKLSLFNSAKCRSIKRGCGFRANIFCCSNKETRNN